MPFLFEIVHHLEGSVVEKTVKFDVHSQSNGFPVVQVLIEGSQGKGWAWVRTPADMMALTADHWVQIEDMGKE